MTRNRSVEHPPDYPAHENRGRTNSYPAAAACAGSAQSSLFLIILIIRYYYPFSGILSGSRSLRFSQESGSGRKIIIQSTSGPAGLIIPSAFKPVRPSLSR